MVVSVPRWPPRGIMVDKTGDAAWTELQTNAITTVERQVADFMGTSAFSLLLVPKLRLGTSRAKLCFASCQTRETEFRGLRSQTEFGNEENRKGAKADEIPPLRLSVLLLNQAMRSNPCGCSLRGRCRWGGRRGP